MCRLQPEADKGRFGSRIIDSERVKQWKVFDKTIICMGTSTGGPRALQVVLSSLPKGVPAPILIVQHMPPVFTKSLANRLNSICQIIVKEAEHGEELQNGIAYIAPGGYHLTVVRKGRSSVIQLTQSPHVNGHRPSVDVLFQSAACLKNINMLAVIMTGMGSDGSNGLKELSRLESLKVIAESETSCIVYGMPKSAIATNLVDDIRELEDIPSTIMNYMR